MSVCFEYLKRYNYAHFTLVFRAPLAIFLFLFLILFTSMVVISFGSLNINGGRDVGKRFLLSDLITRKKLSVVFLQETHTDNSNELEWEVWWRGESMLSHGTNVSAGVAILFEPGLQLSIEKKAEIVPGRLLIVHAQIRNHSFAFINIYAPTVGAERVIFFKKLEEELNKIGQDKAVVLAGDFNCTVNFSLDRNGKEPHLGSAGALEKLLKKHVLQDVWRDKHPTDRQYTWVRSVENRLSAARLDRFYLQKSFCNRVVKASILPCGFLITTLLVWVYVWHQRKVKHHIGNSIISCCRIFPFLKSFALSG